MKPLSKQSKAQGDHVGERPKCLLTYFVLLLLLFSPLSPTATAKSVTELGGDFMEDRWTMADGIPGSQVLSVTQSTDGYIWISTFYGIARFDGLKFTTFDASNPGVPNGTCYQVIAGNDASVWFRFNKSLAIYFEGAFTTIEYLKEENISRIQLLSASHNDSVYVVGVSKDNSKYWICEVDRNGIQRKTPIPVPPDFRAQQFQVATDLKGDSWFRVGQSVGQIRDGQFHSVNGLEPPHGIVAGPISSSQGGIWMAREAEVQRWNNGAWQSSLILLPTEFGRVRRLYETQDNMLWVLGVNGNVCIYRSSHDSAPPKLLHSLASFFRGQVAMDFEGHLWTARGKGEKAESSGLLRLRTRVFRHSATHETLSRIARSFAQITPDSMIVGTAGGVFEAPADFLKTEQSDASVKRVHSGHNWAIAPAGNNSVHLANRDFATKSLRKGSNPSTAPFDLTQVSIPSNQSQAIPPDQELFQW